MTRVTGVQLRVGQSPSERELRHRGNPVEKSGAGLLVRASSFAVCVSDHEPDARAQMVVWEPFMNVGLFGGSFDPIHHGHVALARAAKERFELSRIYFVTANAPPHKQRQPLASYFHRYAMVALATMGEKAFVPSLLEAPELAAGAGTSSKSRVAVGVPASANYSIDT